MQSVSPYLFVYGTLKTACGRNRIAVELHRTAKLVGTAGIPGRMYGLRFYPGLRPSLDDADWVTGELFRLNRPQEILKRLDAYEGEEYQRVVRRVFPSAGQQRYLLGASLGAWVYRLKRPVARHRQIMTGRWTVAQ